MGWNWNGYCSSGCAGSSDPVLALRIFRSKGVAVVCYLGFFSSLRGREGDRDHLLKVSRTWLVFTLEVHLAVGRFWTTWIPMHFDLELEVHSENSRANLFE